MYHHCWIVSKCKLLIPVNILVFALLFSLLKGIKWGEGSRLATRSVTRYVVISLWSDCLSTQGRWCCAVIKRSKPQWPLLRSNDQTSPRGVCCGCDMSWYCKIITMATVHNGDIVKRLGNTGGFWTGYCNEYIEMSINISIVNQPLFTTCVLGCGWAQPLICGNTPFPYLNNIYDWGVLLKLMI